MKLLVINPNTTASMTAKLAAAAEAVADADTTVRATQPDGGPVSIEGYYDEAFAVPGVIDVIKKDAQADAIVIACFDDTGLDAARCLTAAPVIGIGEAGFHLAAMLGGKFGVVTTLSRSIPALEHNLHKYGLASRCARVRAAEVPVLELENPESNAAGEISRQIDLLLREDGAEVIVLGCAGMADLAKALQDRHGVPVIDGVAAAVKLAEGLARLELKTAKSGGYAAPVKKPYDGAMAAWSP